MLFEIPPVIDPLGEHWQQPDRNKILIDETHAMMSQETFEQLQEYNLSDPYVVFDGKMWRRLDEVFARYMARPTAGQPKPIETAWWLIWIGPSNETHAVINRRRIIII